VSTEIFIGFIFLLLTISIKFSYLYSTIFLGFYHVYIDKKISEGNKIIFELLFEGNRYFSRGEIIKAKKKYSQIEFFDPNSIISKIKVGYCHYFLGEFNTSLQYLESVEMENLEKTNKWLGYELGRIVEIIIKCNIDIGNVKKAKILMSKFKSNEKVKSNLVECESWLFYIKNEIDKSVKIIKGRSKFKNLFIELIWDTETKFRDGMILKSVDHYSAIDNFEKCIEHGTVENYFYIESKKMIELLSELE